jgi:hypothetical protein
MPWQMSFIGRGSAAGFFGEAKVIETGMRLSCSMDSFVDLVCRVSNHILLPIFRTWREMGDTTFLMSRDHS